MSADTYAVPIANITIGDALQPRCDGLTEEHIESLLETPEAWPPIVLARVGGALFLVDGFHRFEAALRLEVETINATIFDAPSEDELFLVAFGLNVKHGRALTLRDKKTAAIRLLRDHAELSDRELGRRCGLHHETIGALRTEITFPRAPRRKAGALPDDVGMLDPLRFGRRATKEQKSLAGYVVRLRIALADPYNERSEIAAWPDDAAELARACVAAMGAKRATETLEAVAIDASFLIAAADEVQAVAKEAS
jgi:ParB-like chromosome segregation protein Spo0J